MPAWLCSSISIGCGHPFSMASRKRCSEPTPGLPPYENTSRRAQPAPIIWSKTMSGVMRISSRSRRPWRMTSCPAANGIRWVKPSRATESPSRRSSEIASSSEASSAKALCAMRTAGHDAYRPYRFVRDARNGMSEVALIASASLSSAAETLRRTPLYDRHAAAGARLVPFAGWEMPVQYEGIRPEHIAVRTSAGLFDVSHMGEIETRGADAEAFLQRLLSNDVTKIADGGAQYALLCKEDGGVLDDLFTYKLGPDRYLTVTNASNHAKDLAWFQQHASGYDVELHDALDDYAMLAFQGPNARELARPLIEGDEPARMRAVQGKVAGRDALICGTGYTGEDGVELLLAPGDAG